MNDTIHHYTSISTLALILETKKIRFNRLDRVDDLEEASTICNGINWSKLILVSCWTDSDEENIPLWSMYCKEDGVRLSLPKDIFPLYEKITQIEFSTRPIKTFRYVTWEESVKSEYRFPLFTSPDTPTFFRKIEYLDNLEYAVDINDFGEHVALGMSELASRKNKRWAFQKESRFILIALPAKGFPVKPDAKHQIIENIELPYNYYDLKMKDKIFDNLIVTLKPDTNLEQEEFVSSLLKKHAPKAELKRSSLEGKVKLK